MSDRDLAVEALAEAIRTLSLDLLRKGRHVDYADVKPVLTAFLADREAEVRELLDGCAAEMDRVGEERHALQAQLHRALAEERKTSMPDPADQKATTPPDPGLIPADADVRRGNSREEPTTTDRDRELAHKALDNSPILDLDHDHYLVLRDQVEAVVREGRREGREKALRAASDACYDIAAEYDSIHAHRCAKAIQNILDQAAKE